MRTSLKLFGLTAPIVLAGMATLSLTRGQDRFQPPQPGQRPLPPTPAKQPARDLSKLPVFQRQVLLSAQRGSEWLQRANRGDGRFIPGYVPALRVALDGDSFPHQAGAALALATAARYFNDDKATAIAKQAVLTLLEDTALGDPKQPSVRVFSLPAGVTNHVGAASGLVQAICRLPAPAADVLDQADQLCNGLRRTQRTDGSLNCSGQQSEGNPASDDNDASSIYAGEALYAMILCQQQRPAPWKLEFVRKALTFYQAHWRTSKNMVMVPRHSAAFAEAYFQTKDKAYADCVFEMNDWLCTFQFQQPDPRHPLWVGGFMSCMDGKPALAPPTVLSAANAESLAEAARVARLIGDVARWERYQAALDRGLRFLMTLQYTEANSQHFADWYRPMILGAFHGSHTDSNIRLDYTQLPVCAMITYLKCVAEAR